jgi:hypothetical protein
MQKTDYQQQIDDTRRELGEVKQRLVDLEHRVHGRKAQLATCVTCGAEATPAAMTARGECVVCASQTDGR